jgi:hypothetical protein
MMFQVFRAFYECLGDYGAYKYSQETNSAQIDLKKEDEWIVAAMIQTL